MCAAYRALAAWLPGATRLPGRVMRSTYRDEARPAQTTFGHSERAQHDEMGS